MEMAKLVKEQIKKAGLTQHQISMKMGYETSQFISNISRGVASLPPGKFKQFSKFTNTPLKILMDAYLADERVRVMKSAGIRDL